MNANRLTIKTNNYPNFFTFVHDATFKTNKIY